MWQICVQVYSILIFIPFQVSTSDPDTIAKDPIAVEPEKINSAAPDSSDDNFHQPEQSENIKSCDVAPRNSSDVCNGEVSDSKEAEGEDNNISSSNGSATPVKSGKAKGKHNSIITNILKINNG